MSELEEKSQSLQFEDNGDGTTTATCHFLNPDDNTWVDFVFVIGIGLTDMIKDMFSGQSLEEIHSRWVAETVVVPDNLEEV